MRVRVTVDVVGRWEIWECEVPDGLTDDEVADYYGTGGFDNGVLVDAGQGIEVVTTVEAVGQ